jgi:hypothetical protein
LCQKSIHINDSYDLFSQLFQRLWFIHFLLLFFFSNMEYEF